jgi:hypothetical protein
MSKRKQHKPDFKARVALEALKGEQCRLLSLPRSTFSYTPQGETPLNLTLMRRIDEQFLEAPFYGVRQMTWHLRAEGTPVNEKRIRRLMRLMGLMPIYQRPKTSIRAKEHRIWPYLLRSLRIDRSNHVWCADVSYIPLQRGFLYLTVIMALRRAQEGNPQGLGLAAVEHPTPSTGNTETWSNPISRTDP